MALIARALAHVEPAGVEVVLRVDLCATLLEQRRVESVAVSDRTDAAFPRLGAVRLVRSRHVSGKYGAGTHAADAPRVSEVLAVSEVFPFSAEEVVSGVSVEVAAKSADSVSKFWWDR